MKITRSLISLLLVAVLATLCSCRSETADGDTTDPDPVPDSLTITINTASKKQEMIGFGGALSWYSNWLTTNSKVNEIADLMFTDLGLDIVRFKTWYYPDNYPVNKQVGNMSNTGDNDYAKGHWDATNQLYQLAKERDPKIKTLLCSWGPPVSLKDNSRLQDGTLKKNGGGFMYDEFAEYWNDVLEHTPFNPDYISIQNEPTYGNAGWTSCKWTITESSVLPGYNTALNKVYDKIKNRVHLPLIIGPESQDIQTFSPFVNVLRDNPHCPVLAWHPYNINSTTSASTISTLLKSVGTLSSKPNMMTEYSDNLSWFNTAVFIQEALIQTNTSAYIYWKLMWATPASGEDAAMISTGSAPTSPYEVTPYYHLIKHFSKNIDAGYHRVETTTSTLPLSELVTSAFVSPDEKKVTVIIINTGTAASKAHFVVVGKTAKNLSVVQSSEGNYYSAVSVSDPASAISLPAKTITTAVFDL
jgi:O-glycosyl hydrolase